MLIVPKHCIWIVIMNCSLYILVWNRYALIDHAADGTQYRKKNIDTNNKLLFFYCQRHCFRNTINFADRTKTLFLVSTNEWYALTAVCTYLSETGTLLLWCWRYRPNNTVGKIRWQYYSKLFFFAVSIIVYTYLYF